MAVLALVSWLRYPYQGDRSEVQVNRLSKREYGLMWALTALVRGFYFLLKVLGTTNLIPSTISFTTSFIAVYLTFRRNLCFALGDAANDVILLILWTLAAMDNRSYFSVAAYFTVFLMNDLYVFLNWKRMEKRKGFQSYYNNFFSIP